MVRFPGRIPNLMRKGPHQRMTLAGGGGGGDPIAAFNDGPFPADVGQVTVVLGTTLLANDNTPNPTLIITVQDEVGGSAVLVGQDVQWTQNAVGLESFDYTIKDTVTMAESTATVTMSGVAGAPISNPTPPSSFVATEFHTLDVPKFGPGSITANDTFSNPVTVTVLNPQPVAGPSGVYQTLFDVTTPGVYTLDIATLFPNCNQIEIECWGAGGGVGGILTGLGAPAPGQPEQVPGRGAHRLVTNLSIVPGTLFLSIAVGAAGDPGDSLGPFGGPFNTASTGGAGGVGFADNFFTVGQVDDDSFGFPNGFPGPPSNISPQPGGRGMISGSQRGCTGGFGQDAGRNEISGAGGGGGGGSSVTVGNVTTNLGTTFNVLGPVLNVAGGGAGGAGISSLRRPGTDGGPPGPLRDPSRRTRASTGEHGQNTGSNGGSPFGGVGGGGGGYRGGSGDPQAFLPLGTAKGGHGGESNDERYNRTAAGFTGDPDPAPPGTRPNDGFPGPLSLSRTSSWLTFSGSTTIELPSLQVGNGRIRIRGRVVEDQLGGTQFPVNCFAVDAGPNVDVTPDIPFPGNGGVSTPTVCSFFYFLTDTVTLQTSAVAEVEVDNTPNEIIAVDEGGFLVSELVATNIPIATLLANDTFHDHPPTFIIVPGSEVDCTAIIVGPNVIVTPISATISTTCSFEYEIDDPVMPNGFQLIPKVTPDIGVPTMIVTEFRKAATATVSMVITSPTFIEIFDTGFNAAEQTFIIPPGVDNIEVDCYGARGGISGGYGGDPQGLIGPPSTGAFGCGGGTRRVSNISVTAGDVLSIATGQNGSNGTQVSSSNTPLGGAGGSGNTILFTYNFPGGGNADGGFGGDGLTGPVVGIDTFAGSGGGGGGGTTVANVAGTIMCCTGGGGGGPGHSSSAGLNSVNCFGGSANPALSGGEASSNGASALGRETQNGPLGGGGGGFFGGSVITPPGPNPFGGHNNGGLNGNQTGTLTADPFLGGFLDGRVIIRGRLVP